MHCIDHAIKCRTDVLSNLEKYGVDEKHRTKLEENLEYFKKLKKDTNGNLVYSL